MTQPEQQGVQSEPDRYVDSAAAHLCAVPELEAGQSWTCPDPGCGRQYGQQVPYDVIAVGPMLHDLAAAFVQLGHALAAGSSIEQAQIAIYRVGGQVDRLATACERIKVAVPRG